MASFNFIIITPSGRPFDGPVDSVVVPGSEGMFGVLANHAPMIAGTQTGVVTVRSGSSTSFYGVDDGVLEVRKDAVVLIAAYAEQGKDAEDALAKAKASPVNEPD